METKGIWVIHINSHYGIAIREPGFHQSLSLKHGICIKNIYWRRSGCLACLNYNTCSACKNWQVDRRAQNQVSAYKSKFLFLFLLLRSKSFSTLWTPFLAFFFFFNGNIWLYFWNKDTFNLGTSTWVSTNSLPVTTSSAADSHCSSTYSLASFTNKKNN